MKIEYLRLVSKLRNDDKYNIDPRANIQLWAALRPIRTLEDPTCAIDVYTEAQLQWSDRKSGSS